MKCPIQEAKVLEELRLVVADSLQIDVKSVTPESSIVHDLGAESLDFLDINYRLERIFGVKMARHFFLEHAEEMFGEGTVIDDSGRLTPRAIELFRIRYHDSVPSHLEAGLDMGEVPALITMQAMADAILGILDTLPESCECGATDWHVENETRVVCGACGLSGRFKTGDDVIREWLAQVQEEVGLT
jgi:acyl carrier protein